MNPLYDGVVDTFGSSPQRVPFGLRFHPRFGQHPNVLATMHLSGRAIFAVLIKPKVSTTPSCSTNYSSRARLDRAIRTSSTACSTTTDRACQVAAQESRHGVNERCETCAAL